VSEIDAQRAAQLPPDFWQTECRKLRKELEKERARAEAYRSVAVNLDGGWTPRAVERVDADAAKILSEKGD